MRWPQNRATHWRPRSATSTQCSSDLARSEISLDANDDGEAGSARVDVELSQLSKLVHQPIAVIGIIELHRIDAELHHLIRIEPGIHLRFEIWARQFAGHRGDLIGREVARRPVTEVVADVRPAHHRLTCEVGSGYRSTAQQVVHAVPRLFDRYVGALPRGERTSG